MSPAPSYYDEQVAALCATSPLTRMRRVCASRAADPGGDTVDDAALVARMAEAEAIVTQMTALQAADLAELRRRRVSAQTAHEPAPAADPDGWVVPEVAVTLGLTDNQVHQRLDTAESLARYDTLAMAMSLGKVQSWTAQRLAVLLDELAPHVTADRLRRVEGSTVSWLLAQSRTVTQLTARMRRLITKAKADAGHDTDDDVAARHARRRVSITCERDGTATLWARLPEADGLALAAALDAQARRAVDEADERTVAQRQADLLVAAVTGAPALRGHEADVPDEPPARGVTTRLNVTIPIDSLLPAGTDPGEVPRHGTIPAVTARQLAGADHVEARPIIYDPSTGALLGIGSYLPATTWWADGASTITWRDKVPAVPGYAHPRLMDEFLRTRDRTCRAPGCRRSAESCDCDHHEPYPAGPTSIANSCCLCRRHHRLKTHAPGWSVDGAPDTYLTWRSPSGGVAQTQPHDFRTDDERERDIPPFATATRRR